MQGGTGFGSAFFVPEGIARSDAARPVCQGAWYAFNDGFARVCLCARAASRLRVAGRVAQAAIPQPGLPPAP